MKHATTMNKTTLKNPQGEDFNIYSLFMRYAVYWPWFVGSIAVCLTVSYIYLRYQVPVYNIKSAVLIKEQDSQQNKSSNTLAAIQDLGMMSMTNNFDNELQILKSQTLVKKVVSDLGLYINHSLYHRFGYDTPLYRNEPVKVYMNPEEADLLEGTVEINMEYKAEQPLEAVITYTKDGQRKEMKETFDQLPAALPTEIGVLTFTPDTTTSYQEARLSVHISTPNQCASQYCASMSVEPVSKTTTIAQINVRNTVRQRGIDFIYRLVDIYNKDANDEKNEVAQKTAEFIEDRIAIINRELGNTEETLANFKQRSRLTDLSSDAKMALQETSKYEQQLNENETQINLMQYLENYINNPANKNEVIPANVGIQDPNLANVINQYNTMIVERKRLLRTSSENNPAVINMNSGIDAMRTTVKTTVNSVLRGLEISQKNLLREARKHEGRINNAPTQEKEYMSIARQQEIKASLYTMLLQKREENAITLASTASNGRIIENPLAGKAPIEPKKDVYLLGALIIGMALPVVCIYLMQLVKYKIENRNDVEKLTTVPILAELPKGDIQTSVRGTIVIHENQNNLMEEAFRSFRTNLLFMLEPTQKVVLITSSQPSEGKSFVAGNLAVSMAYLGKKVIVVGLDIRKSGLNKVFGLNGQTAGITNYLNAPEENDLFQLVIPSEISPNLDILPRGNVPPNPTELVSRTALDDAIRLLKERYDLIILDTAPIAMVTDTTIICRVADMCVYVCRADYTPKTVYRYINVMKEQFADIKMGTVINAIDLSKLKHRMNYGYGYKYYGE